MPEQRTIPRICERCQAPFLARATPVRYGIARFCSRLCSSIAQQSRIRHGEAANRRASIEYSAWQEMRARCRNPSHAAYRHYGGRGITVCDAWRESFEAFLADMGRRPSPDHSLDRIDNDGNYEPGNVRWATRERQARNRRSSVLVTFRGVERSVPDWAEDLGISAQTLSHRLKAGWPLERALTTPSTRQR